MKERGLVTFLGCLGLAQTSQQNPDLSITFPAYNHLAFKVPSPLFTNQFFSKGFSKMSLDSNQTSRPNSASALDDADNLSTSSPSCVSWITWHCSLPGNDYLVEIPENWISDPFNLVGLDEVIPMYGQCLDMILDLESDPLYGN